MDFLKFSHVNFFMVIKMRKKSIISTAVVSLLLIAIITTSALATNLNVSHNTVNFEDRQKTEKISKIQRIAHQGIHAGNIK